MFDVYRENCKKLDAYILILLILIKILARAILVARSTLQTLRAVYPIPFYLFQSWHSANNNPFHGALTCKHINSKFVKTS